VECTEGAYGRGQFANVYGGPRVGEALARRQLERRDGEVLRAGAHRQAKRGRGEGVRVTA